MKILITSGGTKVPIDRVRHIANMSSGTFGSKIALEALKFGHEVDFLYAANSKTPFSAYVNFYNSYLDAALKVENIKNDFDIYSNYYKEFVYKDFEDYFDLLKTLVVNTEYDAIVLAAAVSDYGVDNYVDGKIRTKDSDMVIKLKPLPKIISHVKGWSPNSILVGFKLLVDSTDEELTANAVKSIETNKCDMVVANDLRDIKNNAHKLIIVKPNNYHKTYHSIDNDPCALARVVVEELTNIR